MYPNIYSLSFSITYVSIAGYLLTHYSTMLRFEMERKKVLWLPTSLVPFILNALVDNIKTALILSKLSLF